MKNHIAVKFVALFLAAALLTGAVLCGIGVAAFTAGDLYKHTVDEVVAKAMAESAQDYATWLARNYASTELGGCSDEMVNDRYDEHWFSYSYDPDYYGYSLSDSEGNLLLGDDIGLEAEAAHTFTFQPEGKYMHLVSEKTRSQIRAEENAAYIDSMGANVVTDELGNEIPVDGAILQHAIFTGLDGTMLELYYGGGTTTINYIDDHEGQYNFAYSGNLVGQIYFNRDGRLVFAAGMNFSNFDWFENMKVYGAYFHSPGEVDITLKYDGDPVAVGDLEYAPTTGLRFTSYQVLYAPQVAAETILETTAETIPETVPETIPETVPETTGEVTAETIAPTVAETVPETQSSASAYPTEVTEPVFYQDEYDDPLTTVETAILINGKTLDNYQVNTMEYWSNARQVQVSAEYVYLPMPEMTVTIFLTDQAIRDNAVHDLLRQLDGIKDQFLPMAFVCLLGFVIVAVYLCLAAGRKPKSDEVRAGGLNRLPLDLYLCGGAMTVAVLIAVTGQYMSDLLERDFALGCGLGAASVFLSCVIFVGFCFAAVAQIKMPGHFWIKNTLCGWFFRGCFWGSNIVGLWGVEKGGPAFARFCKGFFSWFWNFNVTVWTWVYYASVKALGWFFASFHKVGRRVYRRMNKFMALLPLNWQWIMTGLMILVLMLFFCLAWQSGSGFWIMVIPLAIMGIILYGARNFGLLAQATRRMSKGDLDTKVDDSKLLGCFKDSARDLNALADVAVVAAQQQLKSERMKTELITNVSHDIKTPLTSIINYVDLLQKPHSDSEQEQYLEVLDRQSQRLKKLIDDLMDMSKANTGNMAVEITKVDAVESVNQALGEFSDKLARANLSPVVRSTSESLPMMADGKLVWRVLSNVLSNAVKYAMPGTRLYIDLMEMEGKVILSLKNISREELNVDAEELMERFVRGDESRNTEGSGLGLNIAKSLMELQKGQMQLLIDGDLFKVTLIFPGI